MGEDEAYSSELRSYQGLLPHPSAFSSSRVFLQCHGELLNALPLPFFKHGAAVFKANLSRCEVLALTCPARACQGDSVPSCERSWRVAAGSHTASQTLQKQQGRWDVYATFRYKICFSLVQYKPIIQHANTGLTTVLSSWPSLTVLPVRRCYSDPFPPS